jgi:hypothetical protein
MRLPACAVGTGVLFKSLLCQAVEGECGHGAFEMGGGDAPGAVGAAPAGEVLPFDPDQAFTHTSPALRLGLELGGDGRNTSRERALKVTSCPSPGNIFHEIAGGKVTNGLRPGGHGKD